jgi:acid phosphatase family membrane protein YuiD
MITKTNEAIIPDVRVSHLMEFKTSEHARDELGVDNPTLSQKVVHMISTSVGVMPDSALSNDYHAGPVRSVPFRQSELLAREKGFDSDMVWNERAVSVCIMQELARVAEMLGIQAHIEKTSAEQLASILGLRNEDNLRRLISRDHLAEVIMGMVVGANILLDDPHGSLRGKMNNGNIIGFLGSDGDFSRAAIIVSSYNTPCAKPAWRLRELFPEIEEPQVHEETFSKSIKKVLALYHGWLGGVFSPGMITIGDKVFVNVAPTTPPLPEELE